ncbi:MAG: tetratricopeptide repeat protein [Thermoflexales bacterium]|nr:tetratricopeptide repeat protein [Thermoflexales bacterium]
MSDSSLLATLASYVPAMVVRRLAVNPAPLTVPRGDRFPAAVLFADISGFTSLAEHLDQRDTAGVEELTYILNSYFGQFIDLVAALGGDVIKFAGDAALVLWPAQRVQAAPAQVDLASPPLPEAVRRAAQCGLALQMILNNYEVIKGVHMSMRIGIGTGEVIAASVGGMLGRWEFMVAGDPLTQIGVVTPQAQPGDVVLSPEAYQLIAEQCIGQALPAGGLRLEDVRDPLPLRPPAPLALAPGMETALMSYIPGAILTRLTAQQIGWLAELRLVTVVFLNVTGVGFNLDQLHAVMRALQEVLYRYEGSVNQFIMDDKGINMIAALGLPPLTHEDDTIRGTQVALGMHARLQELGLACAIGVASGRVFCGERGNTRRREYAMIGDTVNLAARLMQAAKDLAGSENLNPTPAVLCDTATYHAAQAKLDLEVLPPIAIKGKSGLVAIYRPRGEKRAPSISSKDRLAANTRQIVNRAAERTILAESLQKLARGVSSLIIIEGEAGIGKSLLISDLRRQAEAMQIGIFAGAGDAVERSTAYHAWRSIFNQVFDLSVMADPAAQRQHFLDLIDCNSELRRLAPLLNPVLPFSLPDNDLSVQMTGQVRADNVRKLLIKLLQESVSRSPKLIILEDAHWLDPSSWALTLAVSQRVHPLLLIIAARPMPSSTSPPAEYIQLLQTSGPQSNRFVSRPLHHVRLSPLSLEETTSLVSQYLDVSSLPEQVAELIYQKSEGNPFFSEELAYALQDSGYIKISTKPMFDSAGRRMCQLMPGVDLKTVSLPGTVQGLITSRIDRLTPSQQFTLKVASVIGQVFSYRTLYDIYPLEADKSQIKDSLDALEQLDLTQLQAVDPEEIYSFKHTLVREAIYSMMLFAQRRQLHQAVAEWYEHVYTHDLSPYYPLLAQHYHLAENVKLERHYAKLAGQQAAARFANAEALLYLERALDLTAEANLAERFEMMLAREKVYDLQGAREAQRQELAHLQELTQMMTSDSSIIRRGSQAANWWTEVALRRATYNLVTGDYPAAIASVKMIIDLAKTVQDIIHVSLDSEAAAYLAWGTALRRQGDYAAAQSKLEQALTLARRADLRQVEADSLRNLGSVCYNLSDYANAKSYSEQALDIYRAIGDRRGESTVLGHLGNLCQQSKRSQAQAASFYRQALAIKQEIGDFQGEGLILGGLGGISHEQGHYTAAQSYYEQSLRIRQKSGDRWGQGRVMYGLGRLLDGLGDYAAAQICLDHSLLIMQEIHDRQGESLGLAQTGLLFHHIGEDEAALKSSQRALQIATELGDRDTQAQALTHLGHALTVLDRLPEAKHAYEQALALRRELGQSVLATEVLAGLTRLALIEEDLAQAQTCAENVLNALEASPPDSTCEPFRIYLSCYRALRANRSPQAQAILETAFKLLQERAEAIDDEERRRSFLENVTAHRQIVEEWNVTRKM